MHRTATLAPGLPEVCRLGLATRGNTHLKIEDVEHAIERGVNYLNWCGHPDGLSHAVARSGSARAHIVVAAQFESRFARDAEREFTSMLGELNTSYIDVLTFYYVESQNEWDEIIAPHGAWEYLAEQRRQGRLKLIGLTSHQRLLAARWAQTGKLDLLMIRYNAAHRGAERDVFPVTQEKRIPIVTHRLTLESSTGAHARRPAAIHAALRCGMLSFLPGQSHRERGAGRAWKS